MENSKLVRDKIPDVIHRGGALPDVEVVGREQFALLLRSKLIEEVHEFLRSGELEELADILEVVFALARELGFDREHLEEVRQAKADERGGFEQRLLWHGNLPAR